MKYVAFKRLIGLRLRPCLPTSSFARHVFQADAIDRTHRNAQLAAGAVGLDDGVHHLVAAQYCVGGANRQAQCAAYAPGFVNNGHAARRFKTVGRVQGQVKLACDGCQSGHALSAARRALVDRSFALSNRVGVRSTIGVAAARALGLRQRCVDASSKVCRVGLVHPRIVRALLAAGCFGDWTFDNGLGHSFHGALGDRFFFCYIFMSCFRQY